MKGKERNIVPSKETLFPRQPLVVWEREYSSLVRIWRCYGSQKLATKTLWKWEAATGRSAVYCTRCASENRSQALQPSGDQGFLSQVKGNADS